MTAEEHPKHESTSNTKMDNAGLEFEHVYTNVNRIQSGSYGTVYVTKHNMTQTEYAVKIIDRTKFKKPEKDTQAVFREVKVMKELAGYSGAVGLVDFFEKPDTFYVVQDLARGGDVFDKLGKMSTYTEKDARDLARVLLNTVDYMHSKQIVHRDLKPENLLISDLVDDTNIKVADFGFAKKIPQPEGYLQTRCGTPAFVAPEILIGSKYGKAVDMWSVGVILYMIIAGYPPFQDPNHRKLFRKIRAGDYVFHDKYWSHVSTEAKQLISSLLTVNPSYRTAADYALQSRWLFLADKSLSSTDLSGSLSGIQKFNAKEKLRSSMHAVKWAVSAKFFNPDNVSFTKQIAKWDLMAMGSKQTTSNTTGGGIDSASTSAASSAEEVVKESMLKKEDLQKIIDGITPVTSDMSGHVSTKVTFNDVYELKQKIRKGSMATVWECVKRNDPQKISYAVKIIKRKEMGHSDDEDVMNEVAVLQSLKHPNIVQLNDFYEEKDYFYMVMEYMTGGDVFDRIVDHKQYTEKDARDLIKCLLETVKFMHDKGVAHRDLKPQNLLLKSTDDDADIKVADFGFAKRVHMPRSLTTRCGTPTYVAPEILKNIPHDHAADMWSVGVICYVLLVGYPPFAGDNQTELFRQIRTGEYEFPKDDWNHICDEAKDLIKLLLVVNPMQRLTAAAALKHEWMMEDEDVLSARDLSVSQRSVQEKKKKLNGIASAVRWLTKGTSAAPSLVPDGLRGMNGNLSPITSPLTSEKELV